MASAFKIKFPTKKNRDVHSYTKGSHEDSSITNCLETESKISVFNGGEKGWRDEGYVLGE